LPDRFTHHYCPELPETIIYPAGVALGIDPHSLTF